MLSGYLSRLNKASRRGVTAALLLLLLAVLLSVPPFEKWLSYFSFDLLATLLPSQRINSVILLEMDEKSFLENDQDYTKIWKRRLHAKLVSKLKADGARGIVFDVDFFDSGPADENEELAQAIKAHGRVAIAMDYVLMAGTGIVGHQPRFPIEPIRQAAASIGLVQVNKDTDGVIRRHFQETELFRSLPWAAAEMTGAKLPKDLASRLQARWLRFPGPPGSALPRLSYVDAFSQTPGFFRDKVVFIGGGPKTKLPGQEVDTFRTPYSRWTGEDTAGVEILATTYVNLMQGNWLRFAPWLIRLGILLVAILVPCVSGVLQNRRIRLLVFAGVLLVLLALPWVMAMAWSCWFSWLNPIVVMVSGYVLVRALSRPAPPEVTPVVASPVFNSAPVPSPAMSSIDAEGVTKINTQVAVPDHELVRLVGRGAYGEVWLAKNAIGSWHAVKIAFKDRFRDLVPYDREFRGIQKFMPISRSHPGFVHVLHVGRNDAQGYFYCIMEAADDEKLGREVQPDTYAPRSLASELKAVGRLPLKECIRVSLRLTEALGFLHEKNLIHRDIKPGNIIYVDNAPKLADIGLVTEIAEGAHKVSYLGTRGYMAPEGPGTPSADIFSLGKVIYEASMGLDCEQFPELPSTLVERPDEHSVHLIRLNQILLKACEPNPAERYQTAAELHEHLLALSKLL
jgi:CHASE2 domain-containing sensor protein